MRPNGTTVDTETVAVNGNGTYSTFNGYTLPATGTVTGTYHWLANYSGDGNNNPASSGSVNEPVSVTAASPTMTTAASPATVTLNGSSPPTLNDSATLSAGYHESGNITFTLYAPAARPSTPRRSRSAATGPTARLPATPCRPPAR